MILTIIQALGVLLIAVAASLALVALLESRRERLEAASRIRYDEGAAAKGGKGRGGLLAWSAKLLEGSGIQLSAREIASLWGAAVVVPPLFVGALTGNITGIAAAALAGAAIPPIYLYTARKRNARRFEEQLGQTMPLIAANLKGGAALRQSIMPVAENMDEPVRGEFRLLTDDISRGMPVPEALDKMAERNKSADIKLFASAVRAQQEGGGNLADIVETVGRTIRVRVEIRAEVRSKTAQGRATAMIMCVVPIALAVALAFMNDLYREFYLSPTGMLVLGACAVMELVGYMVCRKMCDIEVD